MAASKNLNGLVKKVLHFSVLHNSKSGSLRHRSSSVSSISCDEPSLGSSGRSWESLADHVDYNGEPGECSSAPADVPAGCLAVYVGKERRRFVIHTSYLNNNVFRELLAKSEEEFGFKCEGGLRIACSPDVFEHLLWWLEGAHAGARSPVD